MLEQRKAVKSPPPEEEEAAETMQSPFLLPLCRSRAGGREIRSRAEPRNKVRVGRGGKCF